VCARTVCHLCIYLPVYTQLRDGHITMRRLLPSSLSPPPSPSPSHSHSHSFSGPLLTPVYEEVSGSSYTFPSSTSSNLLSSSPPSSAHNTLSASRVRRMNQESTELRVQNELLTAQLAFETKISGKKMAVLEQSNARLTKALTRLTALQTDPDSVEYDAREGSQAILELKRQVRECVCVCVSV
jgi:hypothetical protein